VPAVDVVRYGVASLSLLRSRLVSCTHRSKGVFGRSRAFIGSRSASSTRLCLRRDRARWPFALAGQGPVCRRRSESARLMDSTEIGNETLHWRQIQIAIKYGHKDRTTPAVARTEHCSYSVFLTPTPTPLIRLAPSAYRLQTQLAASELEPFSQARAGNTDVKTGYVIVRLVPSRANARPRSGI